MLIFYTLTIYFTNVLCSNVLVSDENLSIRDLGVNSTGASGAKANSSAQLSFKSSESYHPHLALDANDHEWVIEVPRGEKTANNLIRRFGRLRIIHKLEPFDNLFVVRLHYDDRSTNAILSNATREKRQAAPWYFDLDELENQLNKHKHVKWAARQIALDRDPRKNLTGLNQPDEEVALPNNTTLESEKNHSKRLYLDGGSRNSPFPRRNNYPRRYANRAPNRRFPQAPRPPPRRINYNQRAQYERHQAQLREAARIREMQANGGQQNRYYPGQYPRRGEEFRSHLIEQARNREYERNEVNRNDERRYEGERESNANRFGEERSNFDGEREPEENRYEGERPNFESERQAEQYRNPALAGVRHNIAREPIGLAARQNNILQNNLNSFSHLNPTGRVASSPDANNFGNLNNLLSNAGLLGRNNFPLNSGAAKPRISPSNLLLKGGAPNLPVIPPRVKVEPVEQPTPVSTAFNFKSLFKPKKADIKPESKNFFSFSSIVDAPTNPPKTKEPKQPVKNDENDSELLSLFLGSETKKQAPVTPADDAYIPQQVITKDDIHRPLQEVQQLRFNDPRLGQEWYITSERNSLNVIPVWKHGVTGKGVVVAILDDGIEVNHPDLAANIFHDASVDLNDRDKDPTPRYTAGFHQENSHGTRCAGEISMVANNGRCGVGIAYGAKLAGIRVLDGKITDRLEAEAVSYAMDKIDIYSASWGPNDNGKVFEGPGYLTKKAFEVGIAKGRNGYGSIYVWATGNGGLKGDSCACDGYSSSIYTLSVGSATQSGRFPRYGEMCASTFAVTYSSGNAQEQKISTVDLNGLCSDSHTGTSASAPLAAGIVALGLEANPKLTWRCVQHITVWSATPTPLLANTDWGVNGAGLKVNPRFGFGLMNAEAFVKLAKKWPGLPKQRNCRINVNPTRGQFSVGNPYTAVLKTDACVGSEKQVSYLEHVVMRISVKIAMRGKLRVWLTSPSGTKAILLPNRGNDVSTDGLTNWPLMSVHWWAENPSGEWKATFEEVDIPMSSLGLSFGGSQSPFGFAAPQTQSSVAAEVTKIKLYMYGTKEKPYHLKHAEDYVAKFKMPSQRSIQPSAAFRAPAHTGTTQPFRGLGTAASSQQLNPALNDLFNSDGLDKGFINSATIGNNQFGRNSLPGNNFPGAINSQAQNLFNSQSPNSLNPNAFQNTPGSNGFGLNNIGGNSFGANFPGQFGGPNQLNNFGAGGAGRSFANGNNQFGANRNLF